MPDVLSPGKWHECVPKIPSENLKFRHRILIDAANNPDMQRGLMEICKNDILFWINTFVMQINPDISEKGPFIAWPYQEVAILGGETDIGGEKIFQEGLLPSVVDRKDVRWPKSRDGGASWVVLMVIVWLCLFHDNISAGAISRDEDSVDKKGDPNSLFEKVRIMLSFLPEWMKGDIQDKKGSFQFENGNTFTGEANVASANVGGRLTILLIDEFGQFDKNGEWIYDFTRDVCKCRVFVFTHKDQSGMAYRLCYDAKHKEMREIMTHWSQHPRKNKGLYRFDDQNNKIVALDKNFDFDAICFHNVPKSRHCPECRRHGYRPFEFVWEAKPVGGPCVGVRSPWYDVECRGRNDRDVSMNLDIDPRGATDQFFEAYRIQILKSERSGRPLWQGDLEYDKATGKPIRLIESSKGLVKLWINPKSPTEMPRIKGGAGVDISAGVGSSPSCLSVGDAITGMKILEYQNATILQHEFAAFCVAMLRMFKDENGVHPMLVWEIQYAAVFDAVVRKLQYRPFWIKRDESALGQPRDNRGRAGQNTSPAAFYQLMVEYRHALYDRIITNPSDEALDETLNFVYTSSGEGVEYKARGKRKMDGSGAKIHHGDVVVADALMYKMLKDASKCGFELKEGPKHPTPGSWDFREWLHEKGRDKEENEEWL